MKLPGQPRRVPAPRFHVIPSRPGSGGDVTIVQSALYGTNFGPSGFVEATAKRPDLPLGSGVVLYVNLWDRFALRDTSNHYPDAALPLALAEQWGFDVQNDLDQAATLLLLGGMEQIPTLMATTGVSVIVAASTRETITLSDIHEPFLSLRLSAATQPGSGTITVTGWLLLRQELRERLLARRR